MDWNSKALSTRCVHAGETDDAFGSPRTPLYTTTTFKFPSTADLLDVIEGRKPGGLYTRYGMNPTITAAEAKLASIENSEAALMFASGMAAISALFLAYGRRGIVCVGNLYGGTQELLLGQLPQLGVATHWVSAAERNRLPSLLHSGVGLVFCETPANPTLDIMDLAELAQLAHGNGAVLAVDNTFASPVNQQPLALGADLSVYSATKSLGGHSDLTAGVVCGRGRLVEPVRLWRKNLGQTPSPEVAHLLCRSLATLQLRIERQNATAQFLARELGRHSRVRRVLYPGQPDFPGHAVAKRQMRGFGGILTIEIDGSGEDAARTADRLKLIALAPSLGGIESLVSQPVATSHHGQTAGQLARQGITESMLRLSVGLEDTADLLADLEQALG